MLRTLYVCIAEQHDLRMVGLAALICAFGAYATFVLGGYARQARDSAIRRRWAIATVATTSASIWATHFVAMLAFHVPMPSGFLVLPTILSFFVAVLFVAIGGWLAIGARSRGRLVASGVVAGLAISAMHYVGMSAFRVVGTLHWDAWMVALSIAIGIGFSIAAVMTTRRHGVWLPATFFVLAVCGDHFVAMSAATVAYEPGVELPAGLIDGHALSLLVAGIAGLILLSTLTAHQIHLKARRRRAAERERLQDFADFSVEGLLICDGERIVWANRSIETMLGAPRGEFVGRGIDVVLPPGALAQASDAREIELVIGQGGQATPVRIITRAIVLEDRPHVVVAIRDQRERLRAEAEMKRLADSDALTGLANRARFNEVMALRFASRRAEERVFALLAIDLDRFKQVNDSHGHAAGDAVLVRVAGRLAGIVRDDALIARIGGDEFSIIVGSCSPDEVRNIADRIVEVLARPFVVDGIVHEIGASVGVALAPSDAQTPDDLVRCADLALYRAKEEGRGVYRLFEVEMNARMQQRRSLELALRRAAARQEFELYYQPQVDAKTGRYIGAEALIRWNDGERGVISPAEFIPLAEETNLIAGIGEWVLHTACAEAATWPDDLSVAVNLSPVQFRDPRLLAIVSSALDESGLPGSRLELEITESVLIDDEAGVLALLVAIKKLGVRVSLDDFGIGYSSLGHLHRFPFDKIKIDRSFVSRAPHDRESAAIVRAVVSLGESLGMTTTAEGVETDDQRRFVADEGCDQIQGFLFSRPVPAAQMPAVFGKTPSHPQDSRSSSCPSSASSTAATAS